MTCKSRSLGRNWRGLLGASCLLFALATASDADAFCGFFVTGATSSLYANATMVVLMRDGSRTVLSIQNNYDGPPESFALVVPVPSVLTPEQVKTLPQDVFSHVDNLGAPRLVEYWEQNPCSFGNEGGGANDSGGATAVGGEGGGSGVTVEARFAVGEYDVVILGANDSSALETWLQANDYNIPDGASQVLAPYVAQGMKFFVAKVDPARVNFVAGQALLSPLRFYYDTPDFSLPVRLGLLNSHGTQDLLVNILAPKRYEVANYPNVTVPTNIRVQNEVRDDFAGFYEALFARVIQANPGAVVTEYAWDSATCDPCPTDPLSQTDLATFGADVTQGLGTTPGPSPYVRYTLTRLHYRYSAESLGEDLIFREAPGLSGGRGLPDRQGEFSQAVTTSATSSNQFQGRYAILHPWTTELACSEPYRGIWGGPEGSFAPISKSTSNSALLGAPPTPGNLPALIAQSIPELEVIADNPIDPLTGQPYAGAGGAAGGGVSEGGAPVASGGSATEGGSAQGGESTQGGSARGGESAQGGSARGGSAQGGESTQGGDVNAGRDGGIRVGGGCDACALGTKNPGSAGRTSALGALIALLLFWRRARPSHGRARSPAPDRLRSSARISRT